MRERREKGGGERGNKSRKKRKGRREKEIRITWDKGKEWKKERRKVINGENM